MEIMQKLLEPVVFFSLLGVVFVVSIFVIRSISNLNKSTNEEGEDEARRNKKRISELEAMVVDRDEEHRRKLSQAEEGAKNKEQDLRSMIVGLQDRLKSAEQANANLSGLQTQLNEKEAELKKAISARDELNKIIKGLQEERARLKSDLFLKTQMYDGLKGQYDELEKDTARLNKQLDEERKRPAAEHKPQPQIKPQEQPPEQPLKPKLQLTNPEEKTEQPHIVSDNSSEP